MKFNKRTLWLYGFFMTALLCPGLDGGAVRAQAGVSPEAEWPQWRGAKRDGISAAKGLLKTWPEGGPEVVWRVPIGEGFSSLSIAAGRLYTLAGAGADEFALCLDAANGSEIWRFRSDANFTESQGSGPRSTPTVDGDRVFVLSAKGKLYCLDAASGNKVWSRDLSRHFGSSIPGWGFAGSPLIEGDLLLLEVGGEEGQSIAAFDKKTGVVRWTSYADALAYSSPIALTFNGVRQILFLTGHNLVSVAPADGTVYWSYPWEGAINIATPIFVPDDKIFISAAYGKGAALLEMKAANGTIGVEEIWKSKVMKNWISSSVLHKGYLYGFDNSIFKCIEAETGAEQWKVRGFERGSLILADGHLIALGENGKLALVEATPAAFREKASCQVLEGKCWTQPTLAGGRLYVRNEKELVCLNVAAAGL